jgi:hypothetical protein
VKKPTEDEYRIIATAAAERLGDEGARLLNTVFELALERKWSLRELAEHLQGAECVVNGLIAGWVESDDFERTTTKNHE